MKHLKLLGIFLMLACLCGCSTRLVDFTIISTKNIDLSRGANFKRGQSRIKGIDSASIIIIIPTGTPHIKEAVDRAIESVPGAIALLDGVIYSNMWYIPWIYGKTSFVVEGTPLIDPELTSIKLPSNYIISKSNKRGDIIETKYVSKAEYESIKKKIRGK